MPGLQDFMEQYGWIGVVIFLIADKLVPFVLNKFIPERMKAIEIQRKERVQELMDERSWQHKLDTDRLTVLNEISKSTQNLAISMAQTNANIATILSGQDRMLRKQDVHHDATMQGIADMRVAIGEKIDNQESHDHTDS